MIEINGVTYYRFEVCAIDKKQLPHKRVVARTYFLSRNPDAAYETGKRRLREVGVKGNYFITVNQYWPQLDPAFHGYIVERK